MKIVQLLQGFPVAVNNEESYFIEKHDSVKIYSLSEHDQVLARNLVRRGVFSVSKDNNDTIINNRKESSS